MPVGWEALDRWGENVVRIEPLTVGGVNEVWSVRINGQLAVARLGRRSDRRSDADLAWETELLRYLDREGMAVPVPIPTTDGRDFADGLLVMSYVEGGPPETEAEWRRVADTFRQVHRLCASVLTSDGNAYPNRAIRAFAGSRGSEHAPRRSPRLGSLP